MLQLVQYEISPFCDKVRRALHYKNLAYSVTNLKPSDTLGSRIRKDNPTGRLPYLIDDGQVIGDSTEILDFLERHYPEPALLPSGARDRGLCHALEEWADESLYFYEMWMRFVQPEGAARWIPEILKDERPWMRLIGRFAIPAALRKRLKGQGLGGKSRDELLRDIERQVQAVDNLLQGQEWLLGGQLTRADIAVFVQLTCFQGAPEGLSALESFPAVGDWLKRVDGATAEKRNPAPGQ